MSKSKSLNEVLAGWNIYPRPDAGQRFRHYKGDEYEIVATGFLEDSRVPAVIYRSIEKNIIWVRTAKNFFEEVKFGGVLQPRFLMISKGSDG
jgi:hypothetical protein